MYRSSLPIFRKGTYTAMWKYVLGFAFGFFFSPDLWACASCGSGSSSPMVLYPNEENKVYFGVSWTGQLRDYDYFGLDLPAARPDARQATTLGLGFKPLKELSLVLSDSILVNYANTENRSKTGIGDPFLESRYTFVELSFDRPYQPQVQTILAVKPTWTSSVFDYEDEGGLDIFGSGFHEFFLGLDLWWGIPQFKGGLSSTFGYSLPRETQEGDRIERGLQNKSLVSLTTNFWKNQLSAVVGLEKQLRARDRFNSKLVDLSESEQNNAFASLKFNPTLSEEWKLSYMAAAFAGTRQNATAQRSTILGYSRSL